MPIIRAISFDLWDTLVFDGSDEPKRAARGLPAKPEARRQAAADALVRHAQVPAEQAALAWDVTTAAAARVWWELRVTWTLEERLAVLLDGLAATLPDAAAAALVETLATMEVDIPPDPIPDAAAALAALKAHYRLAIISDTIITPGRELRRLLADVGLDGFFDALVFSDEAGRSKPHRRVFERAAAELGVELEELVHVGDREHNDVAGPQAVGARAVLYVGARDADRLGTGADAVCERLGDLPDIIARLREDT